MMMSNSQSGTRFVFSKLRRRNGIVIISFLLFILIYTLFCFDVPLSSALVKWTCNDRRQDTRPWTEKVNHDNCCSKSMTTVRGNTTIHSITNNNLDPGQTKPQRSSIVSTTPKKAGVEKRHFVFVKVHKAASSTIHTILLRFALSRKLNVLFMKHSHNINQTGTHINKSDIVNHPKGMKFDMLCNHIIYDRSEIAPYFPEDTVYIGVVREPFSQFKSAFVYYSQIWKDKVLGAIISKFPEDPIHGFLQNPWSISLNDPRYNFINNRMSVDFGYPVSDDFEVDKNDKSKIRDFVRKVHKEIDLVLISDLFDESLILLRRFMNWSFKDILYLKNNVFKEIGNSDEIQWINKENYTQEDLRMFRRWATIDYTLYDESMEIFYRKISREEGFHNEVEAYVKVKLVVTDFCERISVNDVRTNKEPLIIGESEWTKSFKVTARDCVKMKTFIDLNDFAKRAQSFRMEKIELLTQFFSDKDGSDE